VVCASIFSRVGLSVYLVTVVDLQRCRKEAEEWVAGRLFCFGGFVALVTVMVGLAQTTTPDYAISTEHVTKIQAIVMSFAHTQRLNLKTGRKNPSPTSRPGVLA
jgi:hypothetical protein